MTSGPLLTIAIPTYNRAGYLEQNLRQLAAEIAVAKVAPGVVEILVSDNCSTDATPDVVQRAIAGGLPIRYVRNERNLGWGPNFSQCFDLAGGTYALLLGDDDLIVDGGLDLLMQRLSARQYGAVVLGSYGYDEDFRAEFPGDYGGEREFRDANEFLRATGPLLTLISACVVNKSLIPGFSLAKYSTGDLAAFPLVLRAALAGKTNLFIKRFIVASKRQNSFSYEFSQVFVNEMWHIYDEHAPLGISAETIRRIEDDELFSYYPFYLFDLRLHRRSDPRVAYENFARRFRGRARFHFWLAPILQLPRPLALAWGAFATVVGRVAGGELRRGLHFAWHKVRARLP